MKLWLKALAAAAIGGAATGATQAVSTTGTIGKGTLAASGAGALITVLAYLMKSPVAQTEATPAVSATPKAQ